MKEKIKAHFQKRNEQIRGRITKTNEQLKAAGAKIKNVFSLRKPKEEPVAEEGEEA